MNATQAAKARQMLDRGPSLNMKKVYQAAAKRWDKLKENGAANGHGPRPVPGRSASETPEAAIHEASLKLISPEMIRPSSTNPRKTFDPAYITELAESIRSVGILQPLVVRLVAQASRLCPYEIVAGECRWRAAKVAKAETIPCMVRTLTDREALEVQVIENLQRKDVPIFEEAAGLRALMDLGGYTADKLAEKLGKSRSHVFEVLRLLKLKGKAVKAVTEGKISMSVGGLLAPLPEAVADEALDDIIENSYDGPMTFKEARKLIEEHFMRKLRSAPFKMDDTVLLMPKGAKFLAAPGTPAFFLSCAQCPKRTGNMPDYDGDSPDICTDVECFAAKGDAAWDTKKKQLAGEGIKVIEKPGYNVVRLDETCYESRSNGKNWATIIKDTGVQPAVSRDDGGNVIQVVDRQAAMAAGKKAGRIKVYSNSSSSDKAAREESKERKDRRKILEKVRERALDKICDKAKKTDLASPEVWKLLASMAANKISMGQTREDVVIGKRWNLTPKKQYGGEFFEEVIKKEVSSLAEAKYLMQCVLELMAVDGWLEYYNAELGENFTLAAEWAGVDLKGMAKDVAAEAAKAKGKK